MLHTIQNSFHVFIAILPTVKSTVRQFPSSEKVQSVKRPQMTIQNEVVQRKTFVCIQDFAATYGVRMSAKSMSTISRT